ncbi:hypothetical protein DFH27DRAFT_307492 [Peziza echinospora]|nr:hypothetical protein DFH27DRAFT_307492 [Peziza echinospora]
MGFNYLPRVSFLSFLYLLGVGRRPCAGIPQGECCCKSGTADEQTRLARKSPFSVAKIITIISTFGYFFFPFSMRVPLGRSVSRPGSAAG